MCVVGGGVGEVFECVCQCEHFLEVELKGHATPPSIAGYLPNSALAVEAMMATASIGAVWSSTSPDFGVSVSSSVLLDM